MISTLGGAGIALTARVWANYLAKQRAFYSKFFILYINHYITISVNTFEQATSHGFCSIHYSFYITYQIHDIIPCF